MKRCFKCRRRKLIGQFYRHSQMADGHLNKCKACTKRDVAARDPEKVRAYEKKRWKDPLRRAYAMRGQRQHRARFPGKYRARNAVSNALRDGRLVKGPCARCGSDDRVQGHHKDYRKPLDVEWQCHKCHRLVEHGKR